MKLRFTKMQGVGNDFIVIDAIHQSIEFTRALCRQLADRHFGIGADQILVVQKPISPGVDFSYRIFNADGGEVEQCGNGSRVFVKFVTDKGLTDKRRIRVETMSVVIEPVLEDDGLVTVDMGAPRLLPGSVGFDINGLRGQAVARTTLWPLTLGSGEAEHTVQIVALSMGNPHAVQIVPRVDEAPVAIDGPLIEGHPRFTKRVNAGFMQIVARDRIKLRVYERGAGETLSCGTGACAAAVSGILREVLDSPVTVETCGGNLTIAWAGEGKPVFMTGPAVTVFEGEIELL